jgi:hypothetical protein
MSTEEYHARQLANDAQNQQASRAAAVAAAERRYRDVRRHLDRAKDLIDKAANPEAYAELEQAIAKLAAIKL